ncbi:MAG: PIG-L family deacetylase [Acidimicrobiales bacterium]
MATLLFFHAHPDDEAGLTGGTMARAAAEGHRVILVVATDGAHGEVPGDLAHGETLVARRRAETEASAAVLGVHRVAWLGYGDSGMTGWAQNEDPGCFWQADIHEAARRLAAVLREEAVEVATIYDWHGMYGHPDHIQVHRVGARATELAGTAKVFEATFNRDHLRQSLERARQVGLTMSGNSEGRDEDLNPDAPADDGNPVGMPASDLTHQVDVSAWIEAKRRALSCHASQVTDTSFFMTLPPELFRDMFGTEWYTERGAPATLQTRWLLD